MAKAARGSSSSGDVFSIERIRALIDLMKEHDLREVDLKQSDQQIRLVRGVEQVAVASGPLAAGASPSPAQAAHSTPSVAPPVEPAAEGPHIQTINSPMVGTYYNKPNPKADDFVKVGSKVSPDTVVCIVEAMKVFNEIPAEISGTIVEILASNEEAVDFNRPLFKVDTRG